MNQNILETLKDKKLISAPNFVYGGLQYLTHMGSFIYNVSNADSDVDFYGFCIPPKEIVFPHLNGHIYGFGGNPETFEQWQQHHIDYELKSYDFQIFNIVKYFSLCADCNPNMLDSLFTQSKHVVHSTRISEMVKTNRKLFLSKKAYYTHKGYAYQQKAKMVKQERSNPKRKESIEKWGYDVKFAYHLVRLLNQCEYILIEHDLELGINAEQLKSIRRGEWTLQQVLDYFDTKERSLEDLYAKSTLRHKIAEKEIKQLLLECLEEYYGSIDECVKTQDRYEIAINDIKNILNKL